MIKNEVDVTRNNTCTYSKGKVKVIKNTQVSNGKIDEHYMIIFKNDGNGVLTNQDVSELFDVLDAIRETNSYHF